MPTGTILAYSIPEGADVLVDGISYPSVFGVSRTPTMVPQIPAGNHTVTFRLSGYIEEIRTVNVSPGGYAAVTAVLRPA